MKALKVSQVSNYISNLIKRESILSNITIEGEVSNLSISGGNIFFNLKDEDASIRSIVFRNYVNEDIMNIKDGQKLKANGSINIYARGSYYQLIVKKIESSGEGDIYKDFINLKNSLEKEGLFDPKIKKEIKSIPSSIGIISSLNGAALRDILKILRRRYPICEIYIYPASVQGSKAVQEIIEGIELFDTDHPMVDFILISRGGGSFEDLNEFNNEKLIRAVYNANIPIISAVGHHVDTTLIDYVSDKFAATPSEAAEVLVPDINDMKNNLENLNEDLNKMISIRIKDELDQMDFLVRELKYNSPFNKLDSMLNYLDDQYYKLIKSVKDIFTAKENSLSHLNAKLNAYDNEKILERGYSIVKYKDNIINDAVDIEEGMLLEIILNNGKVSSRVESKEILNGN
ncbi:MAG: exodeoxyribonuclease VII large subunit [Tissierellia bacterium]|nr:exodeoxyribonuclease VII large subunit [Tissierellia bacterium]